MNWLAIGLAALSALVIGFVWYNPKVFGNAWMKSLNITEEDVQKGNMPLIFGLAFVMAAILATFLYGWVNEAPAQEGEFNTFGHGAVHGVFLGLLVAMPVLVTNALFERRNWQYMLINAGYWVAVCASMGAIVDGMVTGVPH